MGLAGIAVVGLLDFASGAELRAYPLYFGPVGFLAWHTGRRGATAGALLSAVTWLISNALAGMRFASESMWIANASVHGVSFLFVGWLIARLRGALSAARDLSRLDPLTDLRNGRAFYEDTAPLVALCRRTRRAITLAYIDLDNFKNVNDRSGHQAGDNLLRDVARAIKHSVRPSDLAARLGGDEFAVLLPELGPHEAAATMERIRSAVSATAGAESGVTASVGGVTYLAAPLTLEAMVHRADQLMYAAKASGRNAVSHEIVQNGAITDDHAAQA
jgi:diguanylate cyclase (GGDEF)-like protein